MLQLSPAKEKLIQYIQENPQATVVKMVDYFGISKQAMHRHLLELIDLGLISKQGQPPRVYYSTRTPILNYGNKETDERFKGFITIDPSGMEKGWFAFENWCIKRGFDIENYSKIYLETIAKYEKYNNYLGLIDATGKIGDTFKNNCFVDECFYGYFSAIEIFGKTGIYAQMLYSKQSGDKENMKKLFPLVLGKIISLIKNTKDNHKIDAIGFIPPTVPRKVQFMREFEKYLDQELNKKLGLYLPKIEIIKIRNEFIVPQKTLTKPSDRVENAQNTFVVDFIPKCKNILLIDDFVGSGSTFNFVGKKIKQKLEKNQKNILNLKKLKNLVKITCFAIAGTPNGIVNKEIKKFEVINEA